MGDLLVMLFVFACGYIVGETVTLSNLRSHVKKMVEKQHAELEKTEEPQESFIHLRKLITETHNNILYLYDKETRDFICQGQDIDELAQFAHKYKNISSAIVLHDAKLFAFKDGTSHDLEVV